ncbi:pancreatic lipase-related protein 2-like isoform X1 [Dermacentor albipictus]|uniref:pancreatic lipase-related protein 2-like isoform X1 n=1 Tax=Dermacentor albipictus TaxID=60249 RepID=UPI0031FD2E27
MPKRKLSPKRLQLFRIPTRSAVLRSCCEPSSPSRPTAEDEDEYAELSPAEIEDVNRAFRRYLDGAAAYSSDDGAAPAPIRIAGLVGVFEVARNLAHLRPRSPQAVNPSFLIYTNAKNGSVRPSDEPAREPVVTLRHDEDFGAVAKHLGRDQTLYFVVHGYRSKGSAHWVQRIKDEILAVEDATVVVVDWSRASRVANYSLAARSTRTVARLAATMVKTLVDAGVLVPSRIHYIGHSLGAQAGGFFGQDVLALTGSKVGRITGLDPAGPLFEYFDAYVRKEHADFVDIIHTSMGMGFNFFRGRLGMTTESGHVDFYPNGGKHQPGCKSLGRLDCSHSRATLYYANSIRTCSYPALPCYDYGAFESRRCTSCDRTPCGVMGHNASANLRGRHFLSVSSQYPHCPGGAMAARTASLVLVLSSFLTMSTRFIYR